MADSKKHENLIAYLDGELNDEAAAEVEKTLADHAVARQEVEQLTRTWELLDLLPEARASDGFTEKTLTAIRTRIQAPLRTNEDEDVQDDVRPGMVQERAIQIGRRCIGFFVLMLVAAIGFNSTFRRGAEPIDELLKELPLIERLDEYHEAGDVEFLRALHESEMLHGNHDNPDGHRPERDRG